MMTLATRGGRLRLSVVTASLLSATAALAAPELPDELADAGLVLIPIHIARPQPLREPKHLISLNVGGGSGWGGVMGAERDHSRGSIILTYPDGNQYPANFSIFTFPVSITYDRLMRPRLYLGTTLGCRFDVGQYLGKQDDKYEDIAGSALLAWRGSLLAGPAYRVWTTERTSGEARAEAGPMLGQLRPFAAPRALVAKTGESTLPASPRSVLINGAVVRLSFAFLTWSNHMPAATGLVLFYELGWTHAGGVAYSDGRTNFLDQTLYGGVIFRGG